MAVGLLDYAFRGDLRKVMRCINSGVDVDACESSGNTALYYAVSRNQRKCVEYLLRCGANPNRINKEGYTPVNEACFKNNVKCLALLVQYGGSLEQLSADHKESAIVSAYKKHSTRVIHFINLLRDEALTKDGHDLLELEADNNKKDGKKQNVQDTILPGLEAVVPQITAGDLKTPYMRLFDGMPHMTLQSALWHTTPVTVKRFKGREDSRQLLMREADLLSWLRHPRVTLLMAVCLGPRPEHLCLVIERFELASLNHLLYKTQIEMNLPERIHLLLDVAEGMTFLHNHSIVHGFLNSFSVLVYEKFRAKIGNLEFCQEDGEQKHENSCSIHENWMAPEQLLHEPPNMAGDVYSFGVVMWETLARELPWSWLTCTTIKQGLCNYQMTLPMLGLWPSYIQSIVTECLKDPSDRPGFCTVHEYLLAIKNSGDGLTSKVLDGAFPDWFEFESGSTHGEGRRRRTTKLELPPRSSNCGTSEIYVMLRRSSSQGNGRRRSTSVGGGLKEVLKMLSKRTQDDPREKEIERFGYEIAQRLAVTRNIRRLSRNYDRPSWAKEVVLTRALEGDIERVKRNEKTAAIAKKLKKSSRRSRRYSVFNQESFEKILITSSKYLKKDWSKVLHGMEKLKNSMKGFKGKVNEELIECGREPFTDDESISEHSIHVSHVGYEETDAIKALSEDVDRIECQAAAKESLELLSLCKKNRALLTSNTTCSEKETLHDKPHLKNNTESQFPIYAQPVKTRRKSATQEKVRESSDVTVSDATKGGNVNKLNRRSSLNGEDDIKPSNVYAEPYRSGRKSVTQDIEEDFEVRTNSETQSVLQGKRRKSETRSKGFVILRSPQKTPTKCRGYDKSETIYNTETAMHMLYEGDKRRYFHVPDTRKSARLRTQSLSPRERPISARKLNKPRTQSARQIRMEKFERRRKSDMVAVASNTEGTCNVDETLPNDSDNRDHSPHRGLQGKTIKQEPLQKS
ncbi:hypothetical protein ACROYT_G016683 [Oculina patagonica]